MKHSARGGLHRIVAALTSHRMLRSFVGLSGAEVVARSLGLIVLLAVSRSLGPQALGQLAFAQATLAYFLTASDGGLTTLGIRSIVREPERAAEFVVATTVVQIAVSALLIVGLLLFVQLVPVPPRTGRLLMAFSPMLVGGAFNLSYVFQAQEKMGIVSLLRIAREGLGALMALLLLALTHDVVAVAVGAWSGLAVADIIGAAVVSRSGFRIVSFKPALAGRLLRSGLPFLGSALLVQIIVSLDVVVLGFARGDKATGIYSAAYRLAYYTLMVAGVASTVAFPQLVRRWEEDRSDFDRLARSLLEVSAALGLPFAVFVIVEAPQIIRTLYGSNFSASASVLRVVFVLPALGFQNTFLGQYLLAAGQQCRYFWTSAISAIVTAVCLVALVPAFGIPGASATVVLVEVSTYGLFAAMVSHLLDLSVVGPFVRQVIIASSLGILLAALRLAGATSLAPAVVASTGWAAIRFGVSHFHGRRREAD